MSLDSTDAETIARRIRSENGGGIMDHNYLVYQMGGRPGAAPYGWRDSRIHAAIETAVRLKLIERTEDLWTRYRAL